MHKDDKAKLREIIETNSVKIRDMINRECDDVVSEWVKNRLWPDCYEIILFMDKYANGTEKIVVHIVEEYGSSRAVVNCKVRE